MRSSTILTYTLSIALSISIIINAYFYVIITTPPPRASGTETIVLAPLNGYPIQLSETVKLFSQRVTLNSTALVTGRINATAPVHLHHNIYRS
jgi:hypothetical protein